MGRQIRNIIKGLTPGVLKKLGRDVLARVSPRFAINPYTVCKSENIECSFQRFLERLRSRALSLPPELSDLILRRKKELTAQLSNQVRKTSYRHELQELNAAFVCDQVSSSDVACALIYDAVSHRRPTWSVELGSAFGLGAFAASAAMAGTKDGRFDGIEFEVWRAEIADAGVQRTMPGRARVHAGRIEDELPKLIRENKSRVDFAFVDAMHTYEATMGYHDLLSACVSENAWVIYDDVNWSEGMSEAWRMIAASSAVSEAVLVCGRWGLARYRSSQGR